jgi:NADH-quinone oxidoreductase subunit L
VEQFTQLISFVFGSAKGIALLLLAAPLISFVLLFFIKSRKLVNLVSISSISISLLAALYLLKISVDGNTFSLSTPWLTVGNIHIDFSIHIDIVSVLMLTLVSIVAIMVLVFSTEYMRNESRYSIFFGYISLFVFAMFGLLISRNLFWMYLFWELVGFCSYLLIGFYTQKQSAILANKKAFIINRIGDLGFLAGLMLLLSSLGTLDLYELATRIQEHGSFVSIADRQLIHYAGYAFFIAVIAKSAQFPLHIWLPDAMEGPTPVSALIHAATMVIAGVYLLLQIYFLLDPTVLNFIAIIGSFTAFLGAFIAGRQYDLKKILAYSTISQLGYMVMAVGVAAPMAAFYHLYTHAFFKAALFLAAGSIIHRIHTQDIREMSGVRRLLPITFVVYLISAAALVGIPFFSGFFSKEAILNETWHWAQLHGNIYLLVPFFAFAGVMLTAYYVFRHVSLMFFGEQKKIESSIKKEHCAISVPLIVLSTGSLFMYPLYEEVHELAYMPYITISLMSIGFVFAYLLIYKKVVALLPATHLFNRLDTNVSSGLGNVVVYFAKYISWFDQYIVDGFVNFLGNLGVVLSGVAAWLDKYIIDASVNFIGNGTQKVGDIVRISQTGKVQSYFAFSALLLVVIIWFFMRGI